MLTPTILATHTQIPNILDSYKHAYFPCTVYHNRNLQKQISSTPCLTNHYTIHKTTNSPTPYPLTITYVHAMHHTGALRITQVPYASNIEIEIYIL